MFPLLLLFCVIAIKVFRKTTPNGKVTVYLGKRDFIDGGENIDSIDGVVVVDNDYLRGRKVYGRVTTTYRYGREEDEVMGLKFSKELVLASQQIVPSGEKLKKLTAMQDRLMKKLGPTAYPFTFKFPPNAPSSVTLQSGDEETTKPLGVFYNVKTYVAEKEEQDSHKRSSVSLTIKKLQVAPATRCQRVPTAIVNKGFSFSQGQVTLEVTLDKDMYYHGERVAARINVTNTSRKTVKNIRVYIFQHCTVTMVNTQYARRVEGIETKDGCPVTPGFSFSKVYYLVPLASNIKDKHGIALDGYIKDDDVNLASSTLIAEGKSPGDVLGITVSYSLRVKLNCGTLGGELVADVPFQLMYPPPGTSEHENAQALKKARSIERSRYDDNRHIAEEEDNIVFEDFARSRANE